MVGKAVLSPASQGCGGIPTAPSTELAKPILGSKISRHIMPTATGVATKGNNTATRTKRSPLNGRHSSRAMPMPRMSSAVSVTPVKAKVRHTAGQNRVVSVRMLV